MSESARGNTHQLSSSLFLAGLQCYKRLYLECLYRDALDCDAATRAPTRDASLVERIARDLHEGRVVLDSERSRGSQGVASAKELLLDSPVPVIVDASFQHDGVGIRVDILLFARDGSFHLILAESTPGARDHNLMEAALRLHVVVGCGAMVGSTWLLRLKSGCVPLAQDCDVHDLSSLEDITEEALRFQPEIPTALRAMRAAVKGPEPPDVKVGTHCWQPHRCPFYEHCHVEEPDY